MKLNERYFKITITAPTGGIAEGFIDPYKPQDYENFKQEVVESETSAGYAIKAKSHIRWNNLIQNLTQGGVSYLGNVTVDGNATHYVSPTSVSFVMGYEQFEGIFCTDEVGDNGNVFGIEALKQKIANVLSTPCINYDGWYDASEEQYIATPFLKNGKLIAEPLYNDFLEAYESGTISIVEEVVAEDETYVEVEFEG